MSATGFLKRWLGRGGSESAPLTRPTLYADIYNNSVRQSYSPDDTLTEFIGAEDGEPYVVRISESSGFGGWIPLNVLIYAHNEHDAKLRVLQGIKDAIHANQQKAAEYTHTSHVYDSLVSKGYRLLDMAAGRGRDGNVASIQVEKVDKRCLLKVGWAGNDNLI